ncbi:hypothetical protein [Sinomonas susongensis]|uniref:hypothetical protein n=1 Tax=Sinomonas susongensis TaxID=1324851 RepID=UPI0011094714|nr:hypothetical protein [Sinomonas susongensis]
MPKKLLHGIDIAAPGGIQKLLDFHRLTFGDAVMEADPSAGTAGAGEANPTPSDQFKPPASQEEFDRIIQERVARERKKFEGFDGFKAKAEQFDALKAENETLAGKVQTFEAEKAQAKLVADVAKAKGVPASALRGTTKEELEAHADALAELLKPAAPIIPNQERTPNHVTASEEREAARKLFGNSN